MGPSKFVFGQENFFFLPTFQEKKLMFHSENNDLVAVVSICTVQLQYININPQ